MKKLFENIAIVLGCFIIFGFMLTGTYVFAKNPSPLEKKSYYIERETSNDFVEKEIELTTVLSKKVETAQNSYEYQVKIVNGNVVLINLNTGFKESVYSKGNAKFLAQVDYYYYDSTYILIITDEGEIYANIYSNNQSQIKFRKIKTNNNIVELKIIEKQQRFYEYPSVEIYGVNSKGDWERIKL